MSNDPGTFTAIERLVMCLILAAVVAVALPVVFVLALAYVVLFD